jgi:hypothetical protein
VAVSTPANEEIQYVVVEEESCRHDEEGALFALCDEPVAPACSGETRGRRVGMILKGNRTMRSTGAEHAKRSDQQEAKQL